jgi:hypothetical protein
MRSPKAVSTLTFASDGKIGQSEEKNKINKYAKKNSGNEIVVSVKALTDRS